MNTRRPVLIAIALVLLRAQDPAAAASGTTSSTSAAVSATAVASASVRILGSADADVASGAVTLSRAGTLEVIGEKAGTHMTSASVIRVGGAHNAVYAITLAPDVKVTNGARELSVAASAASSGETKSLSPSGGGSVNIRARVDVTAAEASGRYAGFLPITVAFD